MAGIVEIRDTRQESPNGPQILAVTLTDLLKCIAPEGRKLTWTILDLEAVGELSDGRNMLDLEDQIEALPNGLIVSWEALLDLAQSLHQVTNCLLAGVRDPSAVAQIRRERSPVGASDLVLEAIDSSLWSVYARDDRVLTLLRHGNIVATQVETDRPFWSQTGERLPAESLPQRMTQRPVGERTSSRHS
jgi:hypothetical protein